LLIGRSLGPEVNQSGLVRMQLQPELTQPLADGARPDSATPPG
jgi:hypothetical protein